MDANDIEKAFRDQLFEMTALHKKYLLLEQEALDTRWYQFVIRRDLNARKSRIVNRIQELVRQRDLNYSEYLALVQTEQRFADIIKENGWNI